MTGPEAVVASDPVAPEPLTPDPAEAVVSPDPGEGETFTQDIAGFLQLVRRAGIRVDRSTERVLHALDRDPGNPVSLAALMRLLVRMVPK